MKIARALPNSSRKIKILYVINRFELGGVSIVAADIASRIDLDCFDFTIVAGAAKIPDKQTVAKVKARGIKVINNSITPPTTRGLRFGIFRVPVMVVVGSWRMFRIIRRINPDIVHTNTTLVGWVVPFVAWLAGVRVVVHTPHNPPYFFELNYFRSLVFKVLERFSTRFIHTMIALSAHEQALRQKLAVGGSYDMVVFPNAVDSSLLDLARGNNTEALKKKYQIPEGVRLVTMVGRLEHQKDPWTFIEAVRRMVRDLHMRSVMFLVIGDGSLGAGLRASVENDELLRDRVLFLGPRSRQEVLEVLSVSDVFALTPIYEGFGIAILEAMASGLPVVVTDAVPGLVRDGETGFVVGKRDPEAMAVKLCEILNNHDIARRMGERGRIIAQQYDINNFVKRHEQLYKGLFETCIPSH